MSADIVDRYKDAANRLTKDTMDLLPGVYADTIWFIDPLHEVRGLINLRAYYERLYANISFVAFDFHDTIVQDSMASLTWTMRMRHARFRPKEVVEVPGVSVIRFGERITYQRDYLDVGEMVYERVPVLGRAIRAIKSRL